MRVSETVEITCGSEKVWGYACDPIHDPTWCSKVKTVDRLGPDRWLVHHKPIPLRPTMVMTVDLISVEAPYRLTFREEDETSIFDVQYRLESTTSGTRFTQISEFRWKRLPRLAQRLLALGVRRDVRRQLRALKRTLEASSLTRPDAG